MPIELAVEAARRHPDRLAILGNFPLDRPEELIVDHLGRASGTKDDAAWANLDERALCAWLGWTLPERAR